MSTTMGNPDVATICDAMSDTASRVAGLLRQVTDPSVGAVGEWTIGETAAHVAGSADAFLGPARGEAAVERLDEVDAANARALADDPERDLRTLADRVEAGDRRLVSCARRAVGDPVVHPFAGVDVPLSTLLGIELGELLVHGHDIASAAGLGWRIDPAAARLALQAYVPLFPYLLDTSRSHGVTLGLDIRVRGIRPIVVRIADDRLTVDDAGGQRVDAHLAAAPVAYLLLTWNRVPVWLPMAQGRLLVWGRRPWRAGMLSDLMLT